MISTPPEPQDSQPADAAGGRAHFLQVFLSQRSQRKRWSAGACAVAPRRPTWCRTCSWAGAGRWCRSKNSSTYLLRCAGNIAIDHLRSESQRGAQQRRLVARAAGQSGPEPQAALEAGNDLRHVEAARCSLPERTRQIFLLNRIHRSQKVRANRQGHGPSQSAEKHMSRPRSLQSQPS